MAVRLRTSVLLVVAALIATPAHAAQPLPADTTRGQTWIGRMGADLVVDGKLTIQNTAHYCTAPLRWRLDDCAVATVACGAVGLAAVLDDPVRDAVQDRRTETQDRLIDPIGSFGTGVLTASFAGGLYLAGLGFGSPSIRETGRTALVSLALASAVTRVLKIGVGRPRPYLDEGPDGFSAFALDGAHHSFPSGHTTAAFALSSALACRIRNGWASAGLFALATLVAAQRVHADVHWLSDTVAGAVIGTATGVFVAGDSRRRETPTRGRIALVPVVARGGAQGCAIALSL